MTSCIACGSRDVRTAASSASAWSWNNPTEVLGSSRTAAIRVPVDVCRRCGLGWQPTMPSEAQLGALYKSLEDTRYVEEAGSRRKTFRRMAKLVEQAAPARGSLLDIGCSSGFFMESAQDCGWDVSGIEPATWLAARASERFGERVMNTTLQEAPLGNQKFDAVTMWDVLEHVVDPVQFLGAAAAAVKPDGCLALNVPARDSAIARLLGERWPLRLPEHLYYFSKRSLRALFEKVGLRLVGFWLHPVYFSLPYVQSRLEQHGLPMPRFLARVDVEIPVLMGELTVIARRAN